MLSAVATNNAASLLLHVSASLEIEEVSGNVMVRIPGGPFIEGTVLPQGVNSAHSHRPQWRSVSPFWIGQRCITVQQYQERTGRGAESHQVPYPRKEGTDVLQMPIVHIAYRDAASYAENLAGREGGYRRATTPLRLPHEGEWEFAARGPAVKLRELMEAETGRFRAKGFPEWAHERFENLFVEIGGLIYLDTKTEGFQNILRSAATIYGFRVYGTPTGRLNDDEACWDRNGYERKERIRKKAARAAWLSRIPILGKRVFPDSSVGIALRQLFEKSSGSAVPADWGPANAFGLKGMCGGVFQWVDTPDFPKLGLYPSRGGSFLASHPLDVKAAYRSWSDKADNDIGFRMAMSDKV